MTGTFSFTFDRQMARKVFEGISVDRLILAMLARISPAEAWEGCLVYEGPSPSDPNRTACIGTEGSGADEVQEKLVEALEQQGIRVEAVYEGGPEIRGRLARVSQGRWGEP